MLSNLLASFPSQVSPPTAANGKSCFSLHSHKKDCRSLTFCESSETLSVCHVPQMNTPKYQLVRPPLPQTSACGFEFFVSTVTTTLPGTMFNSKEQCMSLPSCWPQNYRLLEVWPWAIYSHTGHTPDKPLSHLTALRGAAWGAPYPWWRGAPRSLVWSTSALGVSRFLIRWSYKTANDTACTTCFPDVKWLAPTCA